MRGRMEIYPRTAAERAMKLQEVLLRATSGKIKWWQAEEVLRLYRDQYFDLNVRHFHEKLSEEHQIGLSYTWVKQALQAAGLVKRKAKRGVHRKRRERRPLPGMMLHIDGSDHQWFQDDVGTI